MVNEELYNWVRVESNVWVNEELYYWVWVEFSDWMDNEFCILLNVASTDVESAQSNHADVGIAVSVAVGDTVSTDESIAVGVAVVADICIAVA